MADRRPGRWRAGAAAALAATVLVVSGCGASDEPPDEGSSPTTTSSTTATAPAAEGSTYVDGRFTSADGGFSVELPQRPREVRQEQPVGDVTLDVVIYDVAVSDTEAYQISFVDYPAAIGDLDPPKVLDGAIEGAVSRTRGSLEQRSDATLAGLAARDAEIGAALPIFVRVALSGRRLFTVQQIGPPAPTAAYARLLETFRLED